MKTKPIVIETEIGTIKCETLPIGRYAEVLKALKTLPTSLQQFQGMDSSQLVSQLPRIIMENMDDFLGVLEVATGQPAEELKKLGLAEIVDIVIAIWTVNKYEDVWSKIKKVTAQPPAK